MKSIFNKADNNELIERIKKLSPETQALWGKMNVGQMLMHVSNPLLVMTGEKKIKFTLLGFLIGKNLKKKFLKERGFGKNLPTHVQFKVTDKKQFEDEQGKLIKLLESLQQNGPAIITKNKHPFFGNMTQDEWADMMYLHANHHLTQFGV